MGDTKQCPKCKETKSVEEFSKNRSKKDGLSYHCKSCVKKYYKDNREKRLEYAKQYRQENREKKRESDKQYQQENRERIAENKKQYRQENRERLLEYQKRHYQENREHYKQYRQENKERLLEYRKRYYQENKERILEHRKQYYEENKDYYAEISRRRHALKRSAIPDHLLNCEVERQRLVDIYALRRIISEATGVEHHVDHMWPLSKGGPHWSGNLQIIPAKKNVSKRDSVDEGLVAVIQSALDEDVERYKRHGKDGSIRY